MTCAEEVGILKRELGPLAGGEHNLSFDILSGRMMVAAALSPEAVIEAVGRTGMKAEPWQDGATPSEAAILAVAPPDGAHDRLAESRFWPGSAWHAWTAGGVLAALGSEGMGLAHDVPLAARILYAVAILSGAWHILPKAWLAARRLRPDMNLLMTIAVFGAVAIGEWFEAATVSFLFAVSLALESWSVGRARRAVAALMDAGSPDRPSRANPTAASGRCLPARSPSARVFVVRPGERIPLDGRVTTGTSEVNQAPITGESVPVPKAPGDTVFAGTINGDGALEVEATKPAGDTTLAHIIRMVGEAQSRRAPSEQWVERFARVYTPAVMAAGAARLWSSRRSFSAAPGATGSTARSCCSSSAAPARS